MADQAAGATSKLFSCSKRMLDGALKIGKDDPRRFVHSLKVGCALSIVSLFYLIDPIFHRVGGQNCIWAVMTVVLVLEFTAGATLLKGLNRGLGTVSAGLLAAMIEYVADEAGATGQAVIIGVSVFVVGFTATYMRFAPYIKKNHDYGMLIFLLTFNLVIVSGYRVSNVVQLATERFYTIAMGCGLCLIISLLFFPIWAGEDLHTFTVMKIEAVSRSLEGSVVHYFERGAMNGDGQLDDDQVCSDCKTILDSQSKDDSLASYASWEPKGCTSWRRHKWKQYLIVGSALRQLSYTIAALHGCQKPNPQLLEGLDVFTRSHSMKLVTDAVQVLDALANSIRRRQRVPSSILIEQLRSSLKDFMDGAEHVLCLSVKTGRTGTEETRLPEETGLITKMPISDSLNCFDSKEKLMYVQFSDALSYASFSSLLVEIASRLERVVLAVEKLGEVTKFEVSGPACSVVVPLEPLSLMAVRIQSHSCGNSAAE